MSRPAAVPFLIETIATTWQVSPAAVMAAAVITGMKPIGRFIVARRAAVKHPGFYQECLLQNEMLIAAQDRHREKINRHSPSAKECCRAKAHRPSTDDQT